MKFKKSIALLILSLSLGVLFGQNYDINKTILKFKNISLEDGLSQNSVLCILQDDEGFLWFGTRNGLNKYDGNTFTTFRYNSQDSTSLSNSYIKSLYQDKLGNLWVGTGNGLNKYDSDKDNFKRYIFPHTKNGTPKDEIWSIIPDSNDHIWIGSNFGLVRMDIRTNEFKHYTHKEEDAGSLSNNLVRALEKTSDGELWIKTVQNIDRFDAKTQSFKNYDHPENSPKAINSNFLPTLYEDSQKNLWLGFTKGLALFNKNLDCFEFFKLPTKNEHAITDDVRSIYEDDFGNLWVGTYRGLYILNRNKNSISHVVHDENDPNSLSQNSIYKIYGDSKGDIWIGTYAGGINYYNRSYDLFKHFSAGTNTTKLNYGVVSSIIQDSNENLWIGTEGGGINYYDKKAGEFTYYTHDAMNQNSLSSNNVKAMIQDRAGNFWIGTHDEGLNFLNPDERSFIFKKYKNNAEDLNSLSNDRVISLYEDGANNIWIGTSGGGLNVLDKRSNSIERVSESTNMIGEIIFIISGTSDPTTILVGGDKGLAKVNTRTKAISSVPFSGIEDDVPGSSPVLSTYKDPDNNLWVGTEGAGLYCYNEISKSSIRYGAEESLPNDVVYGILPDDDDNIWLSTIFGLSRLNLRTRQIKNFDKSDGLQSNEFNYGAYLKNDKGELFFGGVNGFNSFNPDRITENTFIPPVSITSFRVNSKPFTPKADLNDTITLKYDQNVLDFDFVALSYSQPNKNQYTYKLEGFDTGWNEVGNRRSATYTNLDAGHYIFMVKASNNDGLWNKKGASLVFTILPAPWRTWWAYSIYAICFLGALFAIRRNGIQRIHDKNELKQQRLEKERIEEVNKMKLQLFTNISHDFRTPLTLIMGPLERMLKAKEGNDDIRKKHEIMHRNASVLLQLTNQLLDFRKTESGKMELHASKGNIVSFAEDVKLAFEDLAGSRNIEYIFSSPSKNIQVWIDTVMLNKILFNLLSNAFKFTPDDGRISVEINTGKSLKKGMPQGYVKVKVSDSGKGIPMENIDFIFERFYQFGERFGTGIGLALTKSLVQLHQGVITVKSSEKKGTSFIVFFPLGNAHLRPEQIVQDNFAAIENDLYDYDTSVYLAEEPIEQLVKVQTNTVLDELLPSILVVDDNKDVRVFVKDIFKKNYNVFEATNGKCAIEIAKTTSIDLIISDVMMPIMDGMELCHEIKANIRTSHIPVILLTARTSEEYKKSSYRTGADVYITKPFDTEILEVRVTNLLKSRRDFIDKFKKDIILQPKEVTATSADEEFLQRAIEIVEEHMTDSEFTVQVLIDHMNMSRSALYRKLKSLTDQSLTEFIRVIKLKRAAQLMRKTEMTISEIAFDLGFKDQKHFRQSFKRHFKKVPSKYRSENSLKIT